VLHEDLAGTVALFKLFLLLRFFLALRLFSRRAIIFVHLDYLDFEFFAVVLRGNTGASCDGFLTRIA